MDALWQSILDLLSQVVIPDWGKLIKLLPLGLAGLTVLWFAWTIRRFATAGPTRRAPARLTPIAPPDLHMPGPSYAPLIAAVGTAALFGGLVIGGPAVLAGATVLVLALLYWGAEAIRDFERMTRAARPETLPAVVHAGPPPGVHLPGPSFRPLVGAIGTTALMAGLVFGGWVLAAGVVILVATLVGWLVDARAEYTKTVEADRTGHVENIPEPGWPRRFFQTAAVIFVLAVLIQTGVIPPRGGDAEGASGGAPASSAPGVAPATSWTIVAKGIAFDRREIEVPADTPFTITFDNQDPSGVVHDVDIRQADKTTVARNQEVVNGGASGTYAYEGLPAGTYVFICSIHPIPQMTGTLTVK
ncbi:MAG: cupredoxin domain-containing protein [Chloroflexi bacterium]|nr:cupredoxin domain-containing protein [Chloroflexota bacterium]